MESIKGFETYSINRQGEVWRNGRKLRPFGKYPTLSLSKDNTTTSKYVHRLVAETFIPNPENKPFVHHKDGNTANYCADNLEWVTHHENISYRETGLNVDQRGKVCVYIRAEDKPLWNAIPNKSSWLSQKLRE